MATVTAGQAALTLCAGRAVREARVVLGGGGDGDGGADLEAAHGHGARRAHLGDRPAVDQDRDVVEVGGHVARERPRPQDVEGAVP
jgi:hypothetical protein